jgi:phosphoenolpyruvate carboxylase
MLGYSDSNKDGGYWAVNYLLYEAQENIARVSREHGIEFRMFHGRGGSAGRGGGRLYQWILAMPTDCQNGRMRVTEQGEVISFHYELEAMTHRHYEQTVYAMLIATARANATPSNTEFTVQTSHLQLMQQLAEASLKHYRALIQHPDFWQWYIQFTPIEFISKLPIASRPVSRKAASEVDFNNLRAIPWVFSWTQVRYNVPGWFGIGYALNTVLAKQPELLSLMQQLYRDWPFFRLIMNNTQQEMAKAHFLIAEFYQQFSEVESIIPVLKTDFSLAKKYILQITQQEKLLDNNVVLQKSIALRNPYTDVLNLLQVDAIERWSKLNNKKDKEKLTRTILLSVNGLAAAMQATG